MNVLGVIAEFNPFHNGHNHLLLTARARCQADYTIIIMSGDFTQRGEPAIYDKFIRTRLALACGADIVLEMPVAAATASARDFARTGVALLAASGAVNYLAFGCEDVNLPLLYSLADVLSDEPPAYRRAFREALKDGNAWPTARSRALQQFFQDYPPKQLARFLKQPNNILALEYLMALKAFAPPAAAPITPLPVQRIYAGYHDQSLNTPVCSASALRRGILNQLPQDDYLAQFPEKIRSAMQGLIKNQTPMSADDLSQALAYCLAAGSRKQLMDALDMDENLCRRIENMRSHFTGFNDFCDRLSTRAYTRTRISRVLLHTLLGIRTSAQSDLEAAGYAPYLRILGFRRHAAPVLTQIKQRAHIPIISRPAIALRQLPDTPARRLLALDVHAADVYRSILNVRSGIAGVHEFQHKMIVLE